MFMNFLVFKTYSTICLFVILVFHDSDKFPSICPSQGRRWQLARDDSHPNGSFHFILFILQFICFRLSICGISH